MLLSIINVNANLGTYNPNDCIQIVVPSSSSYVILSSVTTPSPNSTIYHGLIDWINVPISISLNGTLACTRLNNLVTGYNYTCQTCTDSLLGGTITCGTTASVVENCACRVN